MNERIKELALAAFQPINDIASEGVADYYTFKQPWFQMYNEKFAELIVRECLEQVRFEVQYEYDLGLADSVSERVLEHFGVEE